MSRPRSRRRWLAFGGAVAGVWLVLLAVVAVRNLPEENPSPPPAPTADSADAGFARDMAVHHQQAVELSFIVRDRTDGEEVRRLAYDIINTQANQRGMLLGRLDAWDLPTISEDPPMAWMEHAREYEPRDGSLMPGMATDTEIDRLRRARGEAAEVLYLQLMTEHHEGGVHMAQAAADQAEDPTIARLAESMVNGQRAEIELMADMLTARGTDPPGQADSRHTHHGA